MHPCTTQGLSVAAVEVGELCLRVEWVCRTHPAALTPVFSVVDGAAPWLTLSTGVNINVAANCTWVWAAARAGRAHTRAATAVQQRMAGVLARRA